MHPEPSYYGQNIQVGVYVFLNFIKRFTVILEPLCGAKNIQELHAIEILDFRNF
jgi:hypothetical protein